MHLENIILKLWAEFQSTLKNQQMKKNKYPLLILLYATILLVASCGPVVFSSNSEKLPPSWFYPNRIETVRYVYFPEHMIYYDLPFQNYIYLNNGTWVTVKVLPKPYSSIDLRRSRFIRVKDYRGDNIYGYHKGNNTNREKSRRQTNVRNRKN